MSKSNPKRQVVAVTITTLFLVLPCLFLYRELRHQRLNHQLILAISNNENDRAIELIHEGADGAAREDSGQPVTIRSILSQFVDQVLRRSASGVDSSRSRRPALLLFYETARGRENTYASDSEAPPLPERLPLLLLDAGAPVSETDHDGYTVVYWAAHFDHHKVLCRLVDHGASVNTSAIQDGVTPLMQSDSSDTRLLLAHGANSNATCIDGETALFTADAPKTRLLVGGGANVDVYDGYHETPLTNACKQGRNETVLALVDYHANISLHDYLGATPLLRAAAACKLDTVQALAKAGADLRDRDSNGTTALMLSLDNSDLRVFDWLLEKGLDVNLQGIDKHTALSIAKQKYDESTGDKAKHAYYGKVIATLIGLGAKPVKPEMAWYGEEGD